MSAHDEKDGQAISSNPATAATSDENTQADKAETNQSITVGSNDNSQAESTKREEPRGEYKLHVPDPSKFIPPEKRREWLLDDGSRMLSQTREPEANMIGAPVFSRGKTRRIVKELLGDEKSPA